MNLSIDLPLEIVEAIAERAAALVSDRLPATEEWLDVDGAAAYMKCGKSRVYALTSQGALPVFKDGSRSLYRRDDLREFILSGGAPRA